MSKIRNIPLVAAMLSLFVLLPLSAASSSEEEKVEQPKSCWEVCGSSLNAFWKGVSEKIESLEAKNSTATEETAPPAATDEAPVDESLKVTIDTESLTGEALLEADLEMGNSEENSETH